MSNGNAILVGEASPQLAASRPARLSGETRIELREITSLLGTRAHAVFWAVNYQQRYGRLPTAAQIVTGLDIDLEIHVSESSADRALRDIRRELCKSTA